MQKLSIYINFKRKLNMKRFPIYMLSLLFGSLALKYLPNWVFLSYIAIYTIIIYYFVVQCCKEIAKELDNDNFDN